jgi:TerC family integral membrane protein
VNVTLTTWLIVLGAILALIVVDLLTVSRKPHEVKFKEAATWSIFYIAVAIGFGIWVWQSSGSQFGTEYFAAYLVEKSLSVDNLFVFIIILAQFKVPSISHQRILMFGVLLALVLRGIFIAVGAAALAAFSFTFVIFGAILIWTGCIQALGFLLSIKQRTPQQTAAFSLQLGCIESNTRAAACCPATTALFTYLRIIRQKRGSTSTHAPSPADAPIIRPRERFTAQEHRAGVRLLQRARAHQ